MRFIDLFAGLGGFHLALTQLGHECVFACEADEELRHIYKKNFGVEPSGDIRDIITESLPQHDILCAGFPCQPFSKAGDQLGFDCPKWGDLFEHTINIIRHHKPSFFILENVPNLVRHGSGRTWISIIEALENAGYTVTSKRLSPHHFGIPQIRDRIYIVGSKGGLTHFTWPKPNKEKLITIKEILEKNPPSAKKLSSQVTNCLNVWQDFLDHYPLEEELPSFPIWSMEFGATYPYENVTPFSISRDLAIYHGSHGTSLKDIPNEEILTKVPSYARTNEITFPKWKIQFIKQNRNLYEKHRIFIDKWHPQILEFPPSLQKLEWNCKGEERNIWKYVIQFRASGVRIKRPTTAPSLVAMTTTQVPIIAWEERYMTPKECARLQSMDNLAVLPKSETKAFKALGNAVNVVVVRSIADALLSICSPLSFLIPLRLETLEKQLPLFRSVETERIHT